MFAQSSRLIKHRRVFWIRTDNLALSWNNAWLNFQQFVTRNIQITKVSTYILYPYFSFSSVITYYYNKRIINLLGRD